MACFETGLPAPLVGPDTASWSERCVEVPWIAVHLGSNGRRLDVGFAMSPPEWMGILLAVVDRGTSLTGIDIVNPRRVRTRYVLKEIERVLAKSAEGAISVRDPGTDSQCMDAARLLVSSGSLLISVPA